jgi:hypothetical protein
MPRIDCGGLTWSLLSWRLDYHWPLRKKMQGLVFLEQERRHAQWNTAYGVLPQSVRIPNEELIGL